MSKYIKGILFMLCFGIISNITIINSKAEENRVGFVYGDIIETDEGEIKEDTPVEELVVDTTKFNKDWYSYRSLYCYYHMTTVEQTFYNKLDKIGQYILANPSIDLSRKGKNGVPYFIGANCDALTAGEAYNLYIFFLFQNPQYYFFDNDLIYDRKRNVFYPSIYPEFQYGKDRVVCQHLFEKYLTEYEDWIAENLQYCKCDYEKQQIIHDYICEIEKYDWADFNQSIYSAVVPQKDNGQVRTVCAGYAKLYTALNNHFGLPTVSVLHFGHDGSHAYNKIQVEGIWYNVDATWNDDRYKGWNYNYYNCSDKFLEHVYCHGATDLVHTLPKSTTTKWYQTINTNQNQKSTCSEYGYNTYVCRYCNNRYRKVLPKLEHTKGEYLTTKNATCLENGIQECHCMVCNEVIDTKILEKTGHNTQIIEEKEPTCTEDGHNKYAICSVCEKQLTQKVIIPKLNHHICSDEKEATCIEDGYTAHKYCDRCHIDLEQSIIIPKLEHNWDNSIISVSPTCEKDGIRVYHCTKCTATKEENIPKLGHDYTDWIIYKKPSYKSVGYEIKYCKHNKAHYYTRQIDKLISFSNIKVSKTTYNIKKGTILNIKYIIYPTTAYNKKVVYKTSNSKITCPQSCIDPHRNGEAMHQLSSPKIQAVHTHRQCTLPDFRYTPSSETNA